MSKERLIALIDGSKLYNTDKLKLIEGIIKDTGGSGLDVEKYRIDKMIEHGLIKEQSQEFISKNKIIDNIFEIMKTAKLYYVLATILTFISIIFNSSKYWGIKLIQEKRITNERHSNQ